jgi:hypothetical protein
MTERYGYGYGDELSDSDLPVSRRGAVTERHHDREPDDADVREIDLTDDADDRDRDGRADAELTDEEGDRPRAATRTESIQGLLERHRDGESVTAGAVVAELLDRHDDYIHEKIEKIDWDAIAAAGPVRTVAEHVEVAERRWDPARAPVLSGRHVLLALAIDADLGWLLLQSGVVASVLDWWQPGLGTPEEPKRLVWDVLADAGRDAAEDQPLLAAAFGAPAEWSVRLPHPATAVAWAPEGERLAFVAGETVYEAAAGQPLRRIAEVGADVVSLAWGSHGLVALRVTKGNAEVAWVSPENSLFILSGVTHGLLSGDGTLAWFATEDGVSGWTSGRTQPVQVAPAAWPLALDTSGRRGLVGRQSDSVLIAGLPGDPPTAAGPGQPAPVPPAPVPPDWPPDAAPPIGWGPPRERPCALVTSGGTTVVATARTGGGVDLHHLPGPAVARIATGAEQVTALVSHPVQAGVAVARGHRIGVWTLSKQRPSARPIPGYDSDRAAGADLLDADRDARALAALIASADLRPPIAIGLFGAWGSGKSFVLRRIEDMLPDFTKQGAAQGYLEKVKFVGFNAWHYAETNLWASMVDQVLRVIGGEVEPDPPPEVARVTAAAEAAGRRAEEATGKVKDAEEALETAKQRFAARRRLFWRLGSAVLLLLAGAVAIAAFGASARMVAAVGTALALLGSAVAALEQVRKARGQADQLAEAGRHGFGAFTRLAGRPEELAVRAAAATLQDRTQEAQAASAQEEQLSSEAARVTQRLEAEPVRAVLDDLATVTEYRDQLSLVTRTRKRFASIDTAVSKAREQRRRVAGEPRAPGGGPIERVVIAIDDLDRCPPDKVITVLEAVHLLFDFPMFVVLLAVDTRWLEQSLRIRYRQLLGETNTATPADYLEKIIQVPLHLLPLDEALVRTMLTGLTGQPMDGGVDVLPPPPGPDDAHPPDHAGTPDGTGTVAPALKATTGRSTRLPLPAEVLRITPAEADAVSAVAPLLGTTPRTIKRFINTYRLLKARALDPWAFDQGTDKLGDHQVLAFLLALVTGRSQVAGYLLPALVRAPEAATVQSVITNLPLPPDPPLDLASALEAVRRWLTEHPDYEHAPAQRFSALAQEVARFSFAPPTMTATIRPR